MSCVYVCMCMCWCCPRSLHRVLLVCDSLSLSTSVSSSSSVSKLRAAVSSSAEDLDLVPVLRRRVLAGHFSSLRPCSWKTPAFKLLVFVSSTFTDTQRERDFLMDELQFELRREAEAHGIQVIFVDMRWGVRDENSCDHKTWVECADMLHWCKEESLGIAFLSLQGDKYGYTPLPRTLNQDALHRHLDATECSSEMRELIFVWYILDENALPREYVLRNLDHKDDEAFWSSFPRLLQALEGLAFDEQHPSLMVGRSVTTFEVWAAFDSYPVELVDKARSFLWSHRQLVGDVTDSLYCDVKQGTERALHLKQLKQFMLDQLSPDAILDYAPLSLPDLQSKPEDGNENRNNYFEAYKANLSSKLRKSLHDVIAAKIWWEQDDSHDGYSGVDLSEALHHSLLAHEKCASFFGREALVTEAMAHIARPHDQRDHAAADLGGICLCVIGVSGAG
jgi:hypothetical protein